MQVPDRHLSNIRNPLDCLEDPEHSYLYDPPICLPPWLQLQAQARGRGNSFRLSNVPQEPEPCWGPGPSTSVVSRHPTSLVIGGLVLRDKSL
jgi:hypothetical protein